MQSLDGIPVPVVCFVYGRCGEGAPAVLAALRLIGMGRAWADGPVETIRGVAREHGVAESTLRGQVAAVLAGIREMLEETGLQAQQVLGKGNA